MNRFGKRFAGAAIALLCFGSSPVLATGDSPVGPEAGLPAEVATAPKPAESSLKPIEAATAPSPSPAANAVPPEAPRATPPVHAQKPAEPAAKSLLREVKAPNAAHPVAACKPAAAASHRVARPAMRRIPASPSYSRAPGVVQVAHSYPFIFGISY